MRMERSLQPSHRAISLVSLVRPVASSSSHRRALAIPSSSRARDSARMGRWSARSNPAGRVISRSGEAGAGDHGTTTGAAGASELMIRCVISIAFLRTTILSTRTSIGHGLCAHRPAHCRTKRRRPRFAGAPRSRPPPRRAPARAGPSRRPPFDPGARLRTRNNGTGPSLSCPCSGSCGCRGHRRFGPSGARHH